MSSNIEQGYGQSDLSKCTDFPNTYSLINEQCWENQLSSQCQEKLENLYVDYFPISFTGSINESGYYTMNLQIKEDFDLDFECFSQDIFFKQYYDDQNKSKSYQPGVFEEYAENNLENYYYDQEQKQIQLNINPQDFDELNCGRTETDDHEIFDCIGEYQIKFAGIQKIQAYFNIQIVKKLNNSSQSESQQQEEEQQVPIIIINNNDYNIEGQNYLETEIESKIHFCPNFECTGFEGEIVAEYIIEGNSFISGISWSVNTDQDLHVYAYSRDILKNHVYYGNSHQDYYQPNFTKYPDGEVDGEADGEIDEGKPFDYSGDITQNPVEEIDETITINFDYLPPEIDTIFYSVKYYSGWDSTPVNIYINHQIFVDNRTYTLLDDQFAFFYKLIKQEDNSWILQLVKTVKNTISDMDQYAQKLIEQHLNTGNEAIYLDEQNVVEKGKKFFVAQVIENDDYKNNRFQRLSIKLERFQPIIHREQFKYISDVGVYISELESLVTVDPVNLLTTNVIIHPEQQDFEDKDHDWQDIFSNTVKLSVVDEIKQTSKSDTKTSQASQLNVLLLPLIIIILF